MSPQRTQRPWVGQRSAEPPRGADLRPELLPLPRQRTCRGRAQPRLRLDVRVRQRLRRVAPGLAPRPDVAASDELFGIDEAVGECRVVVLLAAARPHAGRHVARRRGCSDRVVAVADGRAPRAVRMGADLRDPRGDLRCVEPAPARPDLGIDVPSRRGGAGDGAPARRYLDHHGRPMLLDYVERGTRRGRPDRGGQRRLGGARAVLGLLAVRDARAAATSTGPPRRGRCGERSSLADALQTMLRAFDALVRHAVPVSAPGGTAHPTHLSCHGWQLHAHYYPPLLRSADVAKIPASYELLANLQRDITPEAAAAALRGRDPTRVTRGVRHQAGRAQPCSRLQGCRGRLIGMRIGALAELSGLSAQTIRYYESIDLLPEPDRTPCGIPRLRG